MSDVNVAMSYIHFSAWRSHSSVRLTAIALSCTWDCLVRKHSDDGGRRTSASPKRSMVSMMSTHHSCQGHEVFSASCQDTGGEPSTVSCSWQLPKLRMAQSQLDSIADSNHDQLQPDLMKQK